MSDTSGYEEPFEAPDDEFGMDGIDLNFEGVDAIAGFVPVPTGGYTLEIARARVVPTNDKTGHNVVVTLRVAEGEFADRVIGQDRWYVPNRKVQTPAKYKTTAGFFKGRLEAVYDGSIPDDFTLNVQDLIERRFKAIVTLVDEGWGPQNQITSYLPMSADISKLVIPQATVRPARNGGSGASSSGEAKPGTFKI